MRRPSGEAILIALILLLGTIVRVQGLAFGLPNTAVHPDEGAVVGIAGGMLFAGLNPHFFDWPSFEFYVVAACYRLWWQVEHWRGVFQHKWEIQNVIAAHPANFLLVPRALSAIAGVATIWCVYRLTRDLCGRATALVAALFTSIAFLHVRDSHFGVTEAPMTFLVMAAMLPLARALREPATRRHWIAAGLLTGLAASTKYNGGLMAAAGIAVAAIVWRDGRDTPAGRSAARGGLLRFALAAALAFVAGTPYAVLDPGPFFAALRFDATHLAAGHGVDLGRGWIYHLTFSLRHGLGTPMLVAAIAGIVLLFVRGWRTAVLLCTFPLVYYLLIGRGQTVFVRYVTPLVPFLCITAAVAVVGIEAWMARSGRAARLAAIGVLAGFVAAPSIGSTLAFDTLAGRDDTRVVAAAWIDAHRRPSDWIDEEAPAWLHPAWGRAPGVQVSHFDRDRDAFVSDRGEVVTPEWVVLGHSALDAYADMEALIAPRLAGAYELVTTIPAVGAPESAAIFDRQDHFFVPYADFRLRLRMGPDVRVYRRVHGPEPR